MFIVYCAFDTLHRLNHVDRAYITRICVEGIFPLCFNKADHVLLVGSANLGFLGEFNGSDPSTWYSDPSTSDLCCCSNLPKKTHKSQSPKNPENPMKIQIVA